MIKLKFRPSNHTGAQALTEFALTIGILLLVVYGLLETGRLLFIYSSTVTAARQAVRYGSATGVNGDGTPYYEDCDGIRAAVHNVGFINNFEDSDILIRYDAGVDTLGDPIDIDGANPELDCDTDISGYEMQNNYRIRVQVSTDWQPIVPIVPLEPFTITSESSRTILSSVAIYVTAPPSGWSGSGSGILDITATASPSSFDTVGQVITYTYTITNIGAADYTGPFTVTDDPADNNCESVAPASLAPSASFTCTGTYTVVQQDINDGFVTNIASVPPADNDATVTVSAVQGPELTLVKTGDPDASAIPGTVVNYTYVLTNTGNVTLRAPYDIEDDKSTDETCPATPGFLEPGASVTCTATTTITQADVNAGTLINVAEGTARFGFDTVTSNTATFTVWTPPVYLTITAAPLSITAAGQTINYTYYLKNNTDTEMLSPFTVADTRTTNENCSAAVSPLAPGATNICTGSYVVTQADMDTFTSLTGTVLATAKQQPGNKTRTSNEVTTTVAIVQTPALTLSVSTNPLSATTLGAVVTYTYTLTNSGNVTLSPTFAVTDDQVSPITCTNPTTTIAPGVTKTCTGTRTVTQADLDNGSITNLATATAVFNAQTVTSNQATATVYTYNGNRLNMEKKANYTTVSGVGQIITYTYTLHNTGNSELTNLAVIDDKVAAVDCSLATTPLKPGKKTTCTGTYTTTLADVSAGFVMNQALGTAMNASVVVTSETETFTVTVTP